VTVLGTAALALPVVLTSNGVSVAVCLVVLTAAPLVSVIGYETLRHRHQTAGLERMLAAHASPTEDEVLDHG